MPVILIAAAAVGVVLAHIGALDFMMALRREQSNDPK